MADKNQGTDRNLRGKLDQLAYLEHPLAGNGLLQAINSVHYGSEGKRGEGEVEG
jgi:hypothetical protein